MKTQTQTTYAEFRASIQPELDRRRHSSQQWGDIAMSEMGRRGDGSKLGRPLTEKPTHADKRKIPKYGR